MKSKIYAIYDEKAQVYNTPFFMQNDQTALRAFNNLATDPESTIYKNPEDFKLYHIGMFTDQDGKVTPEGPIVFLANAPLHLPLDFENKPTPEE